MRLSIIDNSVSNAIDSLSNAIGSDSNEIDSNSNLINSDLNAIADLEEQEKWNKHWGPFFLKRDLKGVRFWVQPLPPNLETPIPAPASQP